ncbi:HSP20 family molecular chaperone IbpA [Scopulibacillus darangshiensis]|uniref:HSP20 family molecular chaperone IbpA n=1 Tax=Scopulibacillus darangshiensis TaxID=442528 RepID=A0A4R2P2I8_9BACL|nr:Hsp20/alpha crystallin family protein [Scopulibacillus darangshiensis]TCP28900.1 HSP20 family molecular chaperone IbpA [Scopulibacillus darangshiensis]
MNPFSNQDGIKSYLEGLGIPFLTNMPLNNPGMQKQMQDIMNQSMSGFGGMGNPAAQAQEPPSNQPDYQVFETNNGVIVRLPVIIDDDTRPRLYMDSHHLYVKEFPDQNEELTIQLPAPINPKEANVSYKNGILEAQLMKRTSPSVTEINFD